MDDPILLKLQKFYESHSTMDQNTLMRGVHKKVIHTQTNLQLKTAGLFKYVWPLSRHQTLKGSHFLRNFPANIYFFKFIDSLFLLFTLNIFHTFF